MIDLSPSDPTCIYSTLLFVSDQARNLGIKTPCLTFDQPLWFKATAIIEEKHLDIVCRLGGFHLLMSFLGSVGHLMGGSGLEELLEEVYAPNVIRHIVSGKAFARALRGHMLIHSALLKIIFEDMLQLNLISYDDLNTLAAFNTSEGVESIAPISEKVLHALSLLRNTYSDFRTAEYWYQYIQYIDIVKNYIRAERTGDWLLHLASVEKMLNLFAAT